MAQERSVIKFIRPCLSIHEDKKILTSEYCWQSLNKREPFKSTWITVLYREWRSYQRIQHWKMFVELDCCP